MSVRSELVKLAIFLVVALALLTLLWSTLLNTTSAATKSYQADITDVSGLHTGDNVRIAGVRVGRVEDMNLVDTIARVRFSVRADQPIFENTRVVLRYQNLIGQRFVSLVPGQGPARPLPDGARIPLSRTEPALDLSELLNGFQPLFAVLQPADVNRLSATIIQVLQGSGSDIGPLLEETTQLTNTIADRDKIIGEVIANLTPVLDQIAGKGPELDALLAQSRRLVDGLNANSGPLFNSLDRLRTFTGDADDLIHDVRPDVRTDVRKTVQLTGLFARTRPELRQTVAAFPDFLASIARITQYGSWLNLYACSISLNLPGAPPGTFGTLPGDMHTEVCR
ncbi:MAG TPA: MCE family protein [Pseudonocardia sp.]|jgi:phospholipid/cholesterol/gamma-HCH transport system substrate-binding protein|uniref:MCE family protein n=1 Tax=Pseudonocardia sp. TaxID=60912 RepID=UPI002F3F8037